jgi:predicted nucleotidyltransferase
VSACSSVIARASAQAAAKVAAFLGGSYAKGTADAYSDLDLCLITTDAAYEDFFASREAFLRQLGEPVFLEDFGLPNIVFFIFPDDTEGELWFGSESHLDHIHRGSYRVLLDKKRMLAGAVFPEHEPRQAQQIETLRRQVAWFWHDLSHFTTAIGRGQLWWAHGQLDALRLYCINLARLRQNFSVGDLNDRTLLAHLTKWPPGRFRRGLRPLLNLPWRGFGGAGRRPATPETPQIFILQG